MESEADDVVKYLSEILPELRRLALKANSELLAAMLAMASLEASRILEERTEDRPKRRLPH